MTVSELLSVMDNDEYHYGQELKDHLSSTRAKKALNPGEYGRLYEPSGPYKALMKDDDSQSDAMLFGTLVHDRCLLHEKGWKGHDGRRKQGEDVLYVSRELKTAGSVCQRDLVGCSLNLRDALRYVWSEHSGGDWFFERVATATVEIAEVAFPVKAKFDMLRVDGNKGYLWDIKTCRSAEEWAFMNQVRDLKYDFSLAWYCMVLEKIGIEIVECNWIAVEKSAPWKWDVYNCDHSMLASASIDIDRALLNIVHGRRYGWPDTKCKREDMSYEV